MSGVSFQEFFLLLVIGLVVLGPKRLPQVANQLGSWLGQARRMTRMMKRQLEDEINFDLDSLNVQKQLGLDKDSRPAKTPSVSSPSYVHDPKDTATKTGDSEAAGSTATAKQELPDDYSPAHADDDVGTGVNDETDSSGGDEGAKTLRNEDAGEGAATDAADKKESA